MIIDPRATTSPEPGGSDAQQEAATFSAQLYRSCSLDLRDLPDDELRRHFETHQDEPRIFGPTATTSEFLSMRWLRGEGIEIGAGANPIRLFGDAKRIIVDVDDDRMFMGDGFALAPPVDTSAFPSAFDRKFSFAVASHVLEHCDSFIRAIENLCSVTRQNGIVYLVLPDINALRDREWMTRFDFNHHVEEYGDLMLHAATHDAAYLFSSGDGFGDYNEHATLSAEYIAAARSGHIPQKYRFMHHKHNYDFGGWLSLVEQTRLFLGSKFSILDARYGHERFDCHFVLSVLA